jgi:hypothetical protein
MVAPVNFLSTATALLLDSQLGGKGYAISGKLTAYALVAGLQMGVELGGIGHGGQLVLPLSGSCR